MTEIVFVYVTHPNADDAFALGRNLVEDGLAACANILPGMRTVYRWQGQIEEGSEAVMIIKTRADLLADLQLRIRAEHPYECPCVAALPVSGGNPDYLDWIARSCGERPA
jgi:periplasmic divalent cation tolerance protein